MTHGRLPIPAGLTPGRPDEGVWAYAFDSGFLSQFRVIPRTFESSIHSYTSLLVAVMYGSL
jgi:hypothetical protein